MFVDAMAIAIGFLAGRLILSLSQQQTFVDSEALPTLCSNRESSEKKSKLTNHVVIRQQ
jgi:hypothetical protein